MSFTDDIVLRGAGFEVHGVQVGHEDRVALPAQLLHRGVAHGGVEGAFALVGVDNQRRLLSCCTESTDVC